MKDGDSVFPDASPVKGGRVALVGGNVVPTVQNGKHGAEGKNVLVSLVFG
jgi:hypothetical protein